MKTFTLEEVESLVGKAMKIDSPLGQKIMATFKGISPEIEAKEILGKMNLNRFNNSGYVHKIEHDLKHKLDEMIHIQAMISYDSEYGIAEGTQLERATFEAGYIIGMGAVALSELA